MKVRIDTKAKTLAIEETVTLDELNKFVKAIFPDDWKEWKIQTNVIFGNVTHWHRYDHWRSDPLWVTYCAEPATLIATSGDNITYSAQDYGAGQANAYYCEFKTN